MINHRSAEPSNPYVDHAALATADAIASTQRLADNTLDRLAGNVQEARHDVNHLLNRASEQTSALAQRGLDAMRDTSQGLRDSAQRATDRAVGYIRDEPLKAVLIAAATGAALMAVASMLGGARRRS